MDWEWLVADYDRIRDLVSTMSRVAYGGEEGGTREDVPLGALVDVGIQIEQITIGRRGLVHRTDAERSHPAVAVQRAGG